MTRCPDAAALDPLVLAAVDAVIGPGSQFGNTCAAGANTTDRPRLGVVIDYLQPWLRPCEAHTLSADLAEVRQLPQRLQELLGFNEATSYLGFINGRHPRDWLMSS